MRVCAFLLGIEMLLTMHKEKCCLFLSSELCDHDPLNVNIHVGQGHYNITVKWWKSCQNKVNMKQIRALFPAALWFPDMPFLHEYWHDLFPSDTLKGWWIASLEVLPQQLKSFLFAVQFFYIFQNLFLTQHLRVNQNFNCFCSCDDSCNNITTQTFNIVR